MARDLDVESLRLLVAIHERGSITQAAAHVGLTQPAATARLRAFESRWRLAVFDRGAKGATATADGIAVVAWARTVLERVDSMRENLSALSGERAHELTIAASLTIAGFIVPAWLAELRATSPHVQPRLVAVNSALVGQQVREGRVDLGFIETAEVPSDLVHRRIGFDDLVVVVHPRHRWASERAPLELARLREEQWVLREPGSGTRSTFESALGQPPRVALEVSSTTALVGAAVAGVAPAVVSGRAVANEVDSGRLVRVLTDLALRRPIVALWSKTHRLPAAGEELLSVALRASEREGARG